MAGTVEKSSHIPPVNTTFKLFFASQSSLRALAVATTLAAACITLTNKQTTLVFGIQVDARYSYSPAFKFFAYANLIACFFTVLSMYLVFVLGKKSSVDPIHYFYMFMHDLIITVLLTAACSSATTIGYVGKYGNSHAGWAALCPYFGKFCNRAIAASVLSYFALLFYLVLTVISANRSRILQVC